MSTLGRGPLPYSKIKRLIDLVKDSDLESFSYGDITIKCRPRQRELPQQEESKLTARQKEDFILFGSSGVDNEQ